PRRARVSELEPALEIRRRRLTGRQNDANRIVVFRIVEILDAVDRSLLLENLGDFFEELRLALILLHEVDDFVDLRFGNVSAVNTADARGARRQEQHVARSEKSFRALRVENRTRIDAGGDLIRDTGWKIRLDDAGDDVDR